jgi:uncharacterized membrane protein YeaQ/YmgE (transglycosylase-associated protein family)
MITPGRDPGGIILTIVIGIVGALLGGYIGRAFFHTDLGTFFELRTWVLGLLGAVILIYRAVTGGRRGIFHAEEDFCAGDPVGYHNRVSPAARCTLPALVWSPTVTLSPP